MKKLEFFIFPFDILKEVLILEKKKLLKRPTDLI